jgi:hypothetical protein
MAAAPTIGTNHPPLRNSFKIDFSGSMFTYLHMIQKKAPFAGGLILIFFK